MKKGMLGKALAAAMALVFLCTSCSMFNREEGTLFDSEVSSTQNSSSSDSKSSESSQTESETESESQAESSDPVSSDKENSNNSNNGNGSSSSDKTSKPTPKPTPKSTPKPVETVRVTIPEGYTVAQIAKTLEKNGVCSAKEFVAVSQSYTPKSFTVPSDSNRAFKMEGYLFPDTYEFYVDDDPQDVLIKLLNNYNAKAGGLSSEQLIVASIVERESRSAENAALVASVIYNRLEAGMKLEMDPTRDYINNYVTGSPYLSSTGKFAALYNTYKCSGLPAGPICNPGNRAIQAAVNPASSDYLYFFFGNDNQNHYSKTYEEHQAAMKKYGVQYS